MKKDPLNYQKKVPFQLLAKWRRRSAVIELKRKITNQNFEFKRNVLFYSPFYIPIENVDEYMTDWCDIFFPSKIYNDIKYCAIVMTANHYMHQQVELEIYEQVYTETENYSDTKYEFKLSNNNTKKDKVYELIKTSDPKIDKFNNRTRSEEVNLRLQNWYIDNYRLYKIKECCKLHSLYDEDLNTPLHNLNDPFKYNFNKKKFLISHNNIIVKFITNTKYLTIDILNDLVIKFYDNGEKGWIGHLVDQDNICYDTKNYYEKFNITVGIPIIDTTYFHL